MAFGIANVTLRGYLPMADWMLRDFDAIDIHVRECGDPANFHNYVGRMSLSNCFKSETEIDGFVDCFTDTPIGVMIVVSGSFKFENLSE